MTMSCNMMIMMMPRLNSYLLLTNILRWLLLASSDRYVNRIRLAGTFFASYNTFAMVSVTVSAVANRPPPFARKGLPLTIDVSSDTTVADVKAKVAQKIPKV